jgi:hypothetical protein
VFLPNGFPGGRWQSQLQELTTRQGVRSEESGEGINELLCKTGAQPGQGDLLGSTETQLWVEACAIHSGTSPLKCELVM